MNSEEKGDCVNSGSSLRKRTVNERQKIAETARERRKANGGHKGLDDSRATFPAALARNTQFWCHLSFFHVLGFVGYSGFTIVLALEWGGPTVRWMRRPHSTCQKVHQGKCPPIFLILMGPSIQGQFYMQRFSNTSFGRTLLGSNLWGLLLELTFCRHFSAFPLNCFRIKSEPKMCHKQFEDKKSRGAVRARIQGGHTKWFVLRFSPTFEVFSDCQPA